QQWQGCNDINNLLSHPVDLTQRKPIASAQTQSVCVTGDDLAQLKALCREQAVTLNVVMQFAWHKLLQVYTGDEQTIVGTTVSGRDIPVDGIASSVGLYINTLPLMVRWNDNTTCAEVMQAIQCSMAELNSHSGVSLASLQTQGERLFHSLLVFENYPSPVNNADTLSVNVRESIEKTDYPLSVIAYEGSAGLTIKLSYDGDDIEAAHATRLLNQLRLMLTRVSEQPHLPQQALSLVSDAERHTLLQEWNDTDAPYPHDKTLQQLFEEQVEKTPDNIALVFEEVSLTYQALNERANQLAHHIRAQYQAQHNQPLQPDTLIALYLDRSLEMVISILAVLKAGGAYVPISPEYPQARTLFILEDTQAPILLTQQHHYADKLKHWLSELEAATMLTVVDDAALQQQFDGGHPSDNITPISSSTDLAYVIYTSGTTGQPKGVMVTHKAIVNRLHWMQSEYPLTCVDIVLQKTPYIFDVSVWELLWANQVGARLVMASPDIHTQPELLHELIVQQKITVLHFVPSMLDVFGRYLHATERSLPDAISRVFCSGEALTAAQVDGFTRVKSASVELLNLYGPTEASIDVTYYDCSHIKAGQTPPLGGGIDNIQLYVLNACLQLTPIGTPSELYIGGAGLARGYLHRPELTAERFIDNPFATASDIEKGYTRLYKTGDLVRWLPDGNLAYLGRNDFEVKIRGYRIELGEIESALGQCDAVKQAVVIDREREGHQTLAAYVILEQGALECGVECSELLGTLRQSLSASLPDYMVPASFTVIDAVPLTINGKLDRAALPEPEYIDADAYVAPRSALEAQLCDIWQEVLGLEQVGVKDNFFRIGGDSIRAIRLTAQSRLIGGFDIPLSALFECPTIAQLAEQLKGLSEGGLGGSDRSLMIPKAADVLALGAACPLSFAQERLWFIERFEQGSDSYHIPHLVKLKADVDEGQLLAAINGLVERHAVLNCVYQISEKGESYTCLRDEGLAYQYHAEVLTDKTQLNALMLSDVRRPFALGEEASLRLCRYDLVGQQEEGTLKPVKEKTQNDPERERYLLLMWHHIAFDGWSTDIFLAELSEIYTSLLESSVPQLAELSISYSDYAAWQRDYLQGEVLDKQLDYWRAQLTGFNTLVLPTDRARPAHIDYRGANHRFRLDEGLSDQLREIAKAQKTTLYTVLLSGFYLTLSKVTNQQDILIGTPSDNRHHAQTQSLIGFFVNSLALRVQVHPEQTFSELIAHVHETVRGAKVHQELPFEKLVSELDIERDMSRHPLFQVMFGVQRFGEAQDCRALPFEDAQLLGKARAGESEAGELGSYIPAKYDLSLFMSDSEVAIVGQWNYALSLFDEKTVSRFASMYERTLSQFVGQPQRSMGEVDVLSNEERHTLLHTWNQTDADYPQDKTLHQLFEAQVSQTPDHIALVFEDLELTYCQLNQKANQLAHVIREQYQQRYHQPLKPDTLIALYFDRSLEMVISILAVLKAGGAYVPIAPEYPQERVGFMLSDTQAPILLTQHHHADKLKHWQSELKAEVMLTIVDDATLQQQSDWIGYGHPSDNIIPISSSTDLAYVIYTSGTTGQSKGVMVTQHNVINHALGLKSQLGNAFERVDFSTNYCFDFSVATNLCPLLFGGTVCIYQGDRLDVASYHQHLEQNQITLIKLTPTVAQSILSGSTYQDYTLLFGGESLSEACLAQIPSGVQGIFNEYGPTETTVAATVTRVCTSETISIGKAFPNIRVYNLSGALQIVPIGTPGELYIGGAGVARGYLHRPELTAERFIDNPFATASDIEKGYTRLYKTGDLVRYLPDGNLEYLGRNDFQVKIRGYRIELGEVETALSQIKGVKQAVVIDRQHANSQDGNYHYLAAYVVTNIDGGEIESKAFIDTIRQQ
ncbi:non-ribosomal peptide synthetase, partial [uncultured Shewanella sp.]|uniref:non-ribosomal peptide synthetase n=1 Tax=uncultured Shewanella sp. TaxID=173975 RepID=UPI0026093338